MNAEGEGVSGMANENGDRFHTDAVPREAPILSCRELLPGLMLYRIQDPFLASCARPGQFVNLKTPDGFLRRPISLCRIRPGEGAVDIGIRALGAGTRALCRMGCGERIDWIGPLGRGFLLPPRSNQGTSDDADRPDRPLLLAVGGGIGIFPLLGLLEEARARGMGTLSVLGFRDPSQAFLLREFREISDRSLFASDTGGLDHHGNAVEAVRQLLSDPSVRQAVGKGGLRMAACGPHPMMKAVARLAEDLGIPCQVSLEQRMGCGTGVCLVCACEVRRKNPEGGPATDYVRCCREGPVFDAREVVWE